MTPSEETWARYVSDLAALSDAAIGEITEESRLVADLGFDSLAFTELALILDDRYGSRNFAADLPSVPWLELTAGSVFANYVAVGATATDH
jgi:acyl carrier protein